MSFHQIQTEGRVQPLRQPKNWKVKFPRYMVELPEDVSEISISYIGIQPRHRNAPARGIHSALHHHVTTAVQRQVATMIEDWLNSGSGVLAPKLSEKMYVEAGYDLPDTIVYVMYWTRRDVAEDATRSLDLQKLHQCLPAKDQATVGLWRESFDVPKARFETIYSGKDYQPGIASLEGAEQLSHTFTGYWGAARDRIPASSEDAFEPERPFPTPRFDKDTLHQTLQGRNDVSIVHIRSGQYWEPCSSEECEAYEQILEPVLRKGMTFLEEHAAETGDLGLRFCRNLSTNCILRNEEGTIQGSGIKATHQVNAGTTSEINDGVTAGMHSPTDEKKNDQDYGLLVTSERRRRETCSSGFFRSLDDLENWAANHPTHHKIWHGAHDHSTKFGKDIFKMRTWHEVAALKPGEVLFEYINCEPRTGLIPFLDRESRTML